MWTRGNRGYGDFRGICQVPSMKKWKRSDLLVLSWPAHDELYTAQTIVQASQIKSVSGSFLRHVLIRGVEAFSAGGWEVRARDDSLMANVLTMNACWCRQ
jgi:hypothetical protein